VSGTGTRLRAAFFAALFVGCAASAGAQMPASDGTLPSGVRYEVRADPAQPAAAVALWFRAPASGFDGSPVPGLSRLAALTVSASPPITGTPLTQLVEGWGGRLGVGAYPDSVSVTALVPPDRVRAAVRALTADYFAPVATPDGLKLAQRDTADDVLLRSFGPEAIEDALGGALFATGPLHDGTLGTIPSLASVPFERVRAYAERAFRPSNAILVLTGNVAPAALADVAARAGAMPDAAEAPAPQTPRTTPGAEHRDAGIAGTGLGWIGPPIANEADATAMDFLADALFAQRTGSVQRALGSTKAFVTGRFVTYRDPGVFLVTITGEEAAAARPIVERAIAAAATPMPRPAFESARAGFVYRLLQDMDTPADTADTFGWYAVEGGASYAPAEGAASGRYFEIAGRLTPEAVAHAAATYLGRRPAEVTTAPAQPPKGRTT